MEFNKDIVVGIKLYLGEVNMKGVDINEFIDNFKFVFKPEGEEDFEEEDNELLIGSNKMNARYFDDATGYMYLTFDKEMPVEDVYFFEEEDLIYKKIE